MNCSPTDTLRGGNGRQAPSGSWDAQRQGNGSLLHRLGVRVVVGRDRAVVVGRAHDAVVEERVSLAAHKDVASRAGFDAVHTIVQLPDRPCNLGDQDLTITRRSCWTGLADFIRRRVVLQVWLTDLAAVRLTVVLEPHIALVAAAVAVPPVARERAVVRLLGAGHAGRVERRSLCAVRLVESDRAIGHWATRRAASIPAKRLTRRVFCAFLTHGPCGGGIGIGRTVRAGGGARLILVLACCTRHTVPTHQGVSLDARAVCEARCSGGGCRLKLGTSQARRASRPVAEGPFVARRALVAQASVSQHANAAGAARSRSSVRRAV
eukprot:757348-Hanusia_phi.AAC.3